MGNFTKQNQVDTICMDVETVPVKDRKTGKTINTFTSGVTYSYNKKTYSFYLHSSGRDAMCRELNGNKVVDFYGSHFDSKILLGQDRIVKARNGRYKSGIIVENKRGNISYICYDIFLQALKYIRKVPTDFAAMSYQSPGGLKLDDICKATLGIGKSGSGADAPNLYTQRKYDKLLEYNMRDTELTKKLYDFICVHGYVKNASKIKIPTPYLI